MCERGGIITNIKKSLMTILVVFTIIPILIMLIVYANMFNQKSRQFAKENMRLVADIQKENLQDFFDNIEFSLEIVSQTPTIRRFSVESNNLDISAINDDLKKSVNNIFNMKFKGHESLKAISFVNRSGLITASSKNNNVGILANPGFDISGIKEGKTIFSDVIDINEYSEGKPYFSIAFPVFNNDYMGYLLLDVDMDYFEELSSVDMSYKTGVITVVDKNGNIAYTNSQFQFQNIFKIDAGNTLAEQFRSIDFSKNKNDFIEYHIGGIEKIGYYSVIDKTNWIIFSAIHKSDIISPIYVYIFSAFIFSFVFLVLIIILYYFVSRKISDPLNRLVNVIHAIKGGDLTKKFICNKNNEFGEISSAFNELIETVERQKREITYKNSELEAITNNAPVGIQCLKYDEFLTIKYIGEGFLKLTGYTNDEIEVDFENKYINFVYTDDREDLLSQIDSQLNNNEFLSVEYRIMCKDGSQKWILQSGRVALDESGERVIYGVVIDITKEKIFQNEKDLFAKRYQIVAEQSTSIVFEFDILTGEIYYNENYIKKFCCTPVVQNFPQSMIDANYIYSDDICVFLKFYEDVKGGKKFNEAEIRINTVDGIPVWMFVQATTIFDNRGRPIKAVGRMTDIDEQKKITEYLISKTQKDPLTDLYNKVATQELIEDYIKAEGKDKYHAFFIVDIDNFKEINDNLGHIFGDNVILEISKRISNVFRADDIVGRIGGDEFVVFLKDIKNFSIVADKGLEICEAFRNMPVVENNDFTVSVSVGISYYDKKETNYFELYEKADVALYDAKNKGKDQFCIYGAEE